MRLGSTREATRCFLQSALFRTMAIVSLAFALFGGGLCIVFNLPDDPTNVIMDWLMSLVTVFFVVEIVLRCLVEPTAYPFSAFFFMDIIGTVSMIFEISYLLGHSGRMDVADSRVNVVLMRSARAARMGARVGRLSKLVRCMAIFHPHHRTPMPEGPGRHAKVLNYKLMMILSTKVSLLTVVLVLGVPLLGIGQYPEADLSMRAWSRRLEADYARTYEGMEGLFQQSVSEMLAFYANVAYFPYRLDGYPERATIDGARAVIPGEDLVQGRMPNRQENIVKQPVPSCLIERAGCQGDEHAALYFDLTATKQYDAAMDLVVIVFVVMAMALEAWDLNHTLHLLLVKPVEKMMETVAMMQNVVHEAVDDDRDGPGASPRAETDVVEHALKRLSRLIQVFMDDDILSSKEMVDIDNESRGVIVEIMQRELIAPPVVRRQPTTMGKTSVWAQEGMVIGLPVEREVIDSWELDVLNLLPGDLERVACYVIYDSDVGQSTGRNWAKLDTLQGFVAAARAGYLDNPYHCFAHACDTLAGLGRLLRQVQWSCFLADVDAYALLLSALCHDLGHPGKTNPFLVETGDELALRYNDRSPLENMHCAKLFELCKDPSRDVLQSLSKEAYKHARGVCITSILHTDNAQHFDMVKDVKKAFEVASTTCNAQGQALDPESLVDLYVDEVLCKNIPLWHKLFLHFADISNPLKPFWIYMLWATRVSDEFFAQGDEEKRLGIPVGMLNDRVKVSRPNSEHGFITFLVAPLVTNTVSILPVLKPLACQMANNLESWRNLWVQQANPSLEEIKKRDTDVQKVKQLLENLHGGMRTPSATTHTTTHTHRTNP